MPKKSKNVPKDYTRHKGLVARAIGNRIRQRREQLKLSQEALRQKLQLEGVYISRSQFSRLESGINLFSAVEIISLASALQISYAWLLQGQKDTDPK